MLASAITSVFIFSSLSDPLKRWAVFRCPLCLGFWVGVAIAVIGADPFPRLGLFTQLSYVAKIGFMSSVGSYLLTKYMEAVE